MYPTRGWAHVLHCLRSWVCKSTKADLLQSLLRQCWPLHQHQRIGGHSPKSVLEVDWWWCGGATLVHERHDLRVCGSIKPHPAPSCLILPHPASSCSIVPHPAPSCRRGRAGSQTKLSDSTTSTTTRTFSRLASVWQVFSLNKKKQVLIDFGKHALVFKLLFYSVTIWKIITSDCVSL